MNRLEYQLVKICERNRDGSHATQANRRAMFSLFTEQLKEAGYKINDMRPSDLKGRHINALVTKWKAEELSAGTIKNRMTAIRWWAEKINKSEIVKDNATYGIENRVYVTNESKAISLKDLDLSNIDPNISQSLRLQDAFGLRREESMKFQPEFALDGQTIQNATHIRIKDSWAKGGRARTIPITNDTQRQELEHAYNLVKSNSLIPQSKTYKTHLASFEAVTRKLGIGQTHGLRHGYAQNRYKELMGFPAPAVGGYRVLSLDEKDKDRAVRMKISEELGHSRLNITSVYLGSWSKK